MYVCVCVYVYVCVCMGVLCVCVCVYVCMTTFWCRIGASYFSKNNGESSEGHKQCGCLSG